MSLQPTNVILKLIFDSQNGINDIIKAKKTLDDLTKTSNKQIHTEELKDNKLILSAKQQCIQETKNKELQNVAEIKKQKDKYDAGLQATILKNLDAAKAAEAKAAAAAEAKAAAAAAKAAAAKAAAA